MAKSFKILTILGSPSVKKSNTRALVEDFVEEVEAAGLPLEHQVISLAQKKVTPCKGCWNCTKNRPCPLSKKDDLDEIKAAMIDCDMLIMACPVYTNQVTAQMKALFDRLFTWCHIFPLLGKYSLSACTTGNDGLPETGEFIEKMLATYGTSSFGTISSMGGFTSGFFPFRGRARIKNKKLAQKVARTVLDGKSLPVNKWQRRMFKAMKRKMRGAHTINWMRNGPVEGQPVPSRAKLRFLERIINKMNLNEREMDQLGNFCSFELAWWRSRGWLEARSFKQLARKPIPLNFNVRQRLLEDCYQH